MLQCSDGLSNKVSNIIRRLMDNMKCSSVVLQCSDGLSNKVSNIIRRLMDNMKCSCLYVFYYYQIPSYSLDSISYQCIYGFIPV